MKVTGSWWDNSDSSRHQLHAGKIHSFDFQQTQNQNYWQLQLDDVNEPDFYPMRYDDVRKYADDTCSLYSSFRLPAQLVPNPVSKTATPSSSESENHKEYICTTPENWTVLKDGDDGRTIESFSFTGESKALSVKITDQEVAGLQNDNGDIRFTKVMDWCLPLFHCDHLDNGAFGPERPPLNLWEWQANQMRKYILYLIDHQGFKLKYYCPRDSENPISILAHHICWLYSIKMANMLCGNRSIQDMYSTT